MIDIIIDRLTNSIRNTISGDQFNTEIIQVTVSEKRITKKDWTFNWRQEIQDENKKVYKLVIENNEEINQGLISITDNILINNKMKATKEKDSIDIEFVNRPLTTKEKQSFSEFLKTRKKRKVRKFKKESRATQHAM